MQEMLRGSWINSVNPGAYDLVEASQLLSGQYVEVQVMHRLACVSAAVRYHTEALGKAHFMAELCDDP